MNISINMNKKTIFIQAFGVIVFAMTLGLLFNTHTTSAVSGSEWKAGNIISDAIFYDANSLSAGQIQSFLEAKLPYCDTHGVQQTSYYYNSSSGYVSFSTPTSGSSWVTTSRATYGERYNTYKGRNDGGAPFTCLKNYSQDTPNVGAEAGLCGVYGGGTKSSAQIIYDVSQACGVSPKILLILLQKEQALVGDEWPQGIQYQAATGYACPDTASCNPAYYGFFKQVYYAARQYKLYAKNASSYSYRAGRDNTILYNPVAACGSSSVYIQSQATAGLYIYTPYQPNQAALNNLYGTGDSCSAYGNRNFWRMYNDWFGSTQAGSLVRSVDDATVFLITGDMKYPIGDINILGALYPFGTVSFVPQSYLDTKTTGPLMGRVIRSSDGSVYFYDAGIKLAFGSCAQVEAYGSSCGQSVLLDDYQISLLYTGPYMTNVVTTSSDKHFYVAGGVKREVYDTQSLTENSIPVGDNRLNEASLNALPYGKPIMRDSVFVKNRSNNEMYIYQNDTVSKVGQSMIEAKHLVNQAVPSLDTQSIGALTVGPEIGNLLKVNGGSHYVVSGTGKYVVQDPAQWSDNFTTVTPSVINQISGSSSAGAPYFIKTKDSATIYLLDNKKKRPVTSMYDIFAMTNTTSPVILTIPDSYANTLTTGPYLIRPGSLVKTPDNGTVYMINGLNSKVVLYSFAPASELGLNFNINTLNQSLLDQYPTENGNHLVNTVNCKGEPYTAINGVLYKQSPAYGTRHTLGNSVCDTLRISQNPPEFLRGGDGTIYKITNSTKQPIGSYSKYVQLGGNGSNTIQSTNYALEAYTTGSLL